VVDRVAPHFGVEAVPVTVEEEYFPPPPELRDLLKALAATVTFLAGAPASDTGPILGEDRTTAAADVLAELAP
jgi:4-hydroxy-3-methylbut-2-enyl diphosphate reductase